MSGRHARARRAVSPRTMLAGAGALVALAVAVAALRPGTDDPAPRAGGVTSTGGTSSTSSASCSSSPAALSVVVTPELESAVKAAAGEAEDADPCLSYAVTAAAGRAALTAAVAQQPPAVWIPDSRTWLDELPRALVAEWQVGDSVATSPIGLAVPAADHATTGFSSWSSLIRGNAPLKLANPDQDATSRLAFGTAMTEAPDRLDRATGARLIVMSRFAKPTTSDLLTASDKDFGFPISEAAAYRFAATNPTAELALAFPKAGTPSLDYPWLQQQGLDPAAAAQALALKSALTSTSAKAELTAAGLRVDGGSGPQIDGRAAAIPVAAPIPDDEEREAAAAQWHVLATDMRMLAVIDVSGSMRWASGTPGQTRMDVLIGAADRALSTLPAGSKIGAWIFSTALDGKRDWRPLADIHPLDEKVKGTTQRQHLRSLLKTLPGRIKGDTGLYDTTWAAFEQMSKTYDPRYVNSVVLMTDGVNDDPTGGLSLNTLLSRIKGAYDPDKPIRIVTIGMGEADPRALRRISAATGGTSYLAQTPADIDRVFVEALLARPLPVTR